MAFNRKKTVEIDFIADTSDATRGIKQVGDTAEKQGSKFQQMGDKARLGFATAAVGVGVAIDFLKDATQAALEDERAQADLALALQNTVGATDDQIAKTEDWIDVTARATGVADDELRPALETLTRATGDLDEAQDLLATALDISAATGKPLQTVIEAMGKAINNNAVGPLGRLGLKVRNASGDMLTFDEVMQEAQRTMGGAMETAAGTGSGAMARLQVAFDEAKESVGARLIPALVELADFIDTTFKEQAVPGDQSFLDEVLGDVSAFFNISEDPHVAALIDSFKALGDMIGLYTYPQIQKLGPGARAAMEEVIPALEGGEEGADDLRESVEDATDAFYDQQDAARALYDPVFALYDAQQNLAGATADAKAAADEFGEGSPEHIAALAKVREEWYRVEGAERAVAEQAPVTAESLRIELQKMGIFTKEEIDGIIEEFERVNAFRFRVPTSVRDVRNYTGGGPQAHTGGTIPGDFRGQEVPIMARAGEWVSQGGRPINGSGDGLTVVVQGSVISERELIDIVREAQIRDTRRGRAWG